MDRWTLIYDGDCQFCRRQVELVMRWDGDDRIVAIPFQDAELSGYGISRGAAEAAMHVVSPDGEVWRGAAAAREILTLLPRGRVLAWLFRLPGVMSVAEMVYRWVARHRHRFGCGSDVCVRGTRTD